jgi:hypothetical protein
MSTDLTEQTEPIILHQGRYRLYRKPDNGLHLVYQRDDADEPDHMELPGALLSLAQAAGEGKLTLPEMLREVMKLRGQMLLSTNVSLGPRVATQNQGQVAADLTGRNPGNWTVTFTPADLNCNLPYFEVCHIVITGAPGSLFSVWIDTFQWDTNQNGTANSWDPSVPMPLKPGQYLYFFWSDLATDGMPPTVTLWLRFDQDIRANQAALLGTQAP